MFHCRINCNSGTWRKTWVDTKIFSTNIKCCRFTSIRYCYYRTSTQWIVWWRWYCFGRFIYSSICKNVSISNNTNSAVLAMLCTMISCSFLESYHKRLIPIYIIKKGSLPTIGARRIITRRKCTRRITPHETIHIVTSKKATNIRWWVALIYRTSSPNTSNSFTKFIISWFYSIKSIIFNSIFYFC